MAHPGHDQQGFPARLARSLWVYAQYQLAGLAMSGLSILSMLVADRSVLSREPNLPLTYLVALAIPLGVWGLVKALRLLAATAPAMPGANFQPR